MQAVFKFRSSTFFALSLCLQSACRYSPDGYLGKGNQLFDEGKYEDASINYRNAIRKNPQFAEAYEKLGLCEFARGEVDQSIAALTQAHHIAPLNQGILEELADVSFNRYLSSGRIQVLYDSVTGMVKEILNKNPNSVVGLRLQASLFYGDGRLKEAIATYRQANEIRPFDPAIILPWIETLYLDNDSAKAEALALQLIVHVPAFSPVYDWLSRVYFSSGRVPDAEKILKIRIEKNPKDFRAILVLAAFYRNQQRDREAKELLDSAITRFTDIPDRYALTGNFYSSVGDWADAEMCYRAGMATEPRAKADYLTRLASIYMVQKRNSEAVRSLDEAVKEQPENWRAQALRISLLVDSGNREQVEKAIVQAKAFAQKRPRDGRFPALLARAYAAKGDTRSATTYYQTAASLDRQFVEPRLALAEMSKEKQDFSGMFRYTEEVLEFAPQNLQARLLHAWAWMGQASFGSADKEMRALLKEHPESNDVKLQAGLLYVSEKKPQAAIDMFTKLQQSHGGDQRVLAGLATAYVQHGSPDAAIQLILREVQRDPTSESKRQLLANTAERLGRYDLAIEQFKVLCEAHPNVSEYQFETGKLYEFIGDKPRALSSFERAQRLAPKDATKEGRLAAAYYSAGLVDRADAAYALSVALNPADPVLLNNRAYFLAETGKNPDEALRLAQQALGKIPDNPALLDTLAFSYIRKNSNDSAMSILNRLVHDYPEEPVFRYHLALALAQNGDRAAAIKELQAGLTKHPSKDDQAKIRELISKLG